MVKFVQLVVGPAGSGKSTYCKTIQDHCAMNKRKVHVANLDPAADNYTYEAAFDIRDLVCLDNVMEELGLGPNGGLVYCMEYLLQNTDWLREELDSYGDDEYVILDCPGQVELYCHLPVMHDLSKLLKMWGYMCLSVFIVDALSVLEPSKFISGSLLSLSCMLQLELPHMNVIMKCDIADKEQIEEILDSEGASTITSRDTVTKGRLKKLTEAMGGVIDDFMIVSFVMMDISDEDSISDVMLRTDQCCQYGEDQEPKDFMFDTENDREEN